MEDLDGSLTGTAGNVVVYKNDDFFNGRGDCVDTGDFKNGLVCSDSRSMIRFSFNNYQPSAAEIISVTNSAGKTVTSNKLKKRLTHPFGFMMVLEANEVYNMSFVNNERPTNMSYQGGYYNLGPNEWLIIKHPLQTKPDQVKVSAGSALATEFLSINESNAHSDWSWDENTNTLSYMIKVGIFGKAFFM